VIDWIISTLKRPETAWVLASNAIPVFGVLVLGWAVLPLLIYYWLENVFVGVLNVPKILLTGLTKKPPQKSLALFLTPFFVFHYGIFCFVHGAFIFGLVAAADVFAGRAQPTPETFDVFGRVAAMLRTDGDLRWSVIGLVAVLSLRFIVLWLAQGRWREKLPQEQMMEPYGRVVVLHIALLVCAVPVVALGQPLFAVLALAALKAALELGLPQLQVDPAARVGKA
jgi:hypothetical protein